MSVVLVRCRAETGPRETNVTGVYPPLGLAYVAAALREGGYPVTVIDAEAERLSPEALMARIPIEASIIGFTSTSLLWPTVRQVAAAARNRFPGRLMVIGGPHVTAFPEETMAGGAFDVGVLGDGEHAALRIAERHASGSSLADLPGCIVAENGRVRSNLPVPWIQDLDALPFPALDLLPMTAYRSVMVKTPFVTMVTSRGCPYRCSFCSQIYAGNKLRTRSPKNIVDEMERNLREFGAREIVLFDETFGVKRRDALEVCALIRERGLRFRWNARTRIDVLDEELLKALRGAGCYALHLGVEAGTQRILDEMNKKTSLAQVRRAVELARSMGFWLHAYFMIGYPGETKAEIAQTLRFSRELNLDWASYTITIPSPCTPLYDRARREKYVPGDFWREYALGRTALDIPFFESDECSGSYLKRAKRLAYLRFYLRPVVLARNLVFFVSSGGWRRFFQAFGLWLREELL